MKTRSPRKAERPLSVQLRGFRRGARERAGAPVDTTQWYPRLMRKDFKVGLNVTESEVDDPDAQFYENYECGALRNYTGYCNKSVDELINRQSREPDAGKRRQLVWQIEQQLIEEDARPLVRARRHLPAAIRQRSDQHGQQHLQWLPLRRRLARQVASRH
jgi:hypothetical protein